MHLAAVVGRGVFAPYFRVETVCRCPSAPPTRRSFPNPSKADTVHRRQALVGNLAWYEDWCNASIPKDDAACMEQMQVRVC